MNKSGVDMQEMINRYNLAMSGGTLDGWSTQTHCGLRAVWT